MRTAKSPRRSRRTLGRARTRPGSLSRLPRSKASTAFTSWAAARCRTAIRTWTTSRTPGISQARTARRRRRPALRSALMVAWAVVGSSAAASGVARGVHRPSPPASLGGAATSVPQLMARISILVRPRLARRERVASTRCSPLEALVPRTCLRRSSACSCRRRRGRVRFGRSSPRQTASMMVASAWPLPRRAGVRTPSRRLRASRRAPVKTSRQRTAVASPCPSVAAARRPGRTTM
mmetsp:Transcript_9736/g.28567  ORF Transcript_9736/g.28567 Transcript_9736/m.28567 type:complete len:236 (-) Transcript_9736:455-1162(-)